MDEPKPKQSPISIDKAWEIVGRLVPEFVEEGEVDFKAMLEDVDVMEVKKRDEAPLSEGLEAIKKLAAGDQVGADDHAKAIYFLAERDRLRAEKLKAEQGDKEGVDALRFRSAELMAIHTRGLQSGNGN